MKKLPRPKSAAEESLALQLRALKIAGWEREFMFHPTRLWRLDFAWPAVKLAVEVEGGIFSGGRHTRPAGFEADCEKYNELSLAHWQLLRFTPAMIRSGRAISMIRIALVLAEGWT